MIRDTGGSVRFEYGGYRVLVEYVGHWRAQVRSARPGARDHWRLAVQGYGTEGETVEAVKRWIDKGRRR
jgi:hypothetical protein